MDFRKYINIVEAGEVIDKDRLKDPKKDTLNNPEPGDSTVVIYNDPHTPFEVVVEAVMSATKLPEAEVIKRVMSAHNQGHVAVAAYSSRDVAETVASNIMQHARSNKRYDHYRAFSKYMGPWPLHAEVLDNDY